jgi:isocitrate lyase
MFQLDDKFLQEIGLDALPADQRQAFLAHIYSELELRVGVRLSEGLSDEQLSEFESFVDRKEDQVRAWVAVHAPNYANDQSYLQIKATAPAATPEADVLAEYASLKWLSMNRPNYREVVAQVLSELKSEIINNREAILGSGDQAA